MTNNQQQQQQPPQNTGVRRGGAVGSKQEKKKEQPAPASSFPSYTSPPTLRALLATPEAYRSDAFVEAARRSSADHLCSEVSSSSQGDRNLCHIPFDPLAKSQVGVMLYVGAFVDPRAYAPLAQRLSQRYGLPVVIPVFDKDVPLNFGSPSMCNSGRLELAQAEFPNVNKWVLAGHSLGGLAAAADVWTAMTAAASEEEEIATADDRTATKRMDKIGGLVLMASDIQNIGCGETDFSATHLPMAMVTASEDTVLNATRWELNRRKASQETFYVDVMGGNHGQFGSYDDSGRIDVLGPSQLDGTATIPDIVQWDISAAAIYHVAARTGVPLPPRPTVMMAPDGSVVEQDIAEMLLRLATPAPSKARPPCHDDTIFQGGNKLSSRTTTLSSTTNSTTRSAGSSYTSSTAPFLMDAASSAHSFWFYGAIFLLWLGKKL
jgi:hypothetical protein